MSDGLFTQTDERGGVRREVSSRAWLRAMLDAESALAHACAVNDVVPKESAESIAAACADADSYDEATLGIAAAATGNPVMGLVRAIRAAVPDDVASDVHYGATSQDTMDTAAMLVAQRAIAAILRDLDGATIATAQLSSEHEDTAMVARTLLQQAVPSTFAYRAAAWLDGLTAVSVRLAAVQDSLPVQLGGAVGTMDGFPDFQVGQRVRETFATKLGLDSSEQPWHTLRYPIGDLAGALGTTAGILSKIALDLILLAQDEIGEVVPRPDGRGASTAMAHKRNPVAAIAARSGAKRAPGLVATLFAAMEQELDRAAGAWQAEWSTLSQLLTCVGSSAAWLRDALENLEVHQERMTANLAGRVSPDDDGTM